MPRKKPAPVTTLETVDIKVTKKWLHLINDCQALHPYCDMRIRVIQGQPVAYKVLDEEVKLGVESSVLPLISLFGAGNGK